MSVKKKIKRTKKTAKKIAKVIKKNPELAIDIMAIIFSASGMSKGND